VMSWCEGMQCSRLTTRMSLEWRRGAVKQRVVVTLC